MLLQQSISIPLDVTIPLWQFVVGMASLVSALSVALYRINKYGKYHELHFEHADDSSIHQTKEQRDMAILNIKRELDSHIALDTQQHVHVTSTLMEIKHDFSIWQSKINDSILEFTAAIGRLQK